ncbi:MAG: TadE family protein [Candidatus Cybelea sp.]
MVEMAIIMVALLSLTFGIIDFGRALYTYTWMTDVAQRAVRWGIVRGKNCTLLDHCNVGLNTNAGYAPSWVIGQDVGIVDPTKLNISCDYGGQGVPGSLMVCYVVYPFTFMLPFLPSSASPINFRTAARMHFTN